MADARLLNLRECQSQPPCQHHQQQRRQRHHKRQVCIGLRLTAEEVSGIRQTATESWGKRGCVD